MANQVVKLKKGSDYLYPLASMSGIDTSNIIASNIDFPYTATQDCWAYIKPSSHQDYQILIYLDGQIVWFNYYSLNYQCLFVKKGQTISSSYASEGKIMSVFGLKYTTN